MTSFTVKTPGDLAAAIKAVQPHAGTDKLPMLNTVRFRVIGDKLILDATDRYTLGQARVDVADVDGDELTFLLSIESVKNVLKLASLRNAPMVTFTATGAGVTVSNYESEVRVRTEDYTFPNIDQLVVAARDNIDKADTAGPRAFGAKHLAKFDKAGDKHAVVSFWPARRNSVVLVTVGHDFVGLVVQFRADLPELPALIVQP